MSAFDKGRFAPREVAVYTRPVPQPKSEDAFFYVLALGEELAKFLGVGHKHPALVAWGDGDMRGRLLVSKAPDGGAQWKVRTTNWGHVLLTLSTLPSWVRRDVEFIERSLAYERDPSGLIIQFPIKAVKE
jgi:hypothetical protein